jgi:hypothetical protein
MKIFILNQGRAYPFVGWLAIDEFAELLAKYLQATIISVKNPPQSRWDRVLMKKGEIVAEGYAGDIAGDLLVVIARSSLDLALIRALGDYRYRFGKIVAWVADSYFYEGYSNFVRDYDLLAVTAHEDVDFLRSKYGIKAACVYHGIDCYKVVPRKNVPRSIDLIGFGRLPSSYLKAMKARFHDMKNPYLFMHSPIGSTTGPDIAIERGMLFKLLQRAKLSLAFHLFCEPEGKRPRSMMLTSRWLESLAAGCLVVGKRPVSRMSDEMLFWDDATVELSDDAAVAVEEVEAILRNFSNFLEVRRESVTNLIAPHDWRYRISQLSEMWGIKMGGELKSDLIGLGALASKNIL